MLKTCFRMLSLKDLQHLQQPHMMLPRHDIDLRPEGLLIFICINLVAIIWTEGSQIPAEYTV